MPSYDHLDKMYSSHPNKANILVGLVWFTWFFNIVIFFIILCNFLIAFICSSYEEILEQQVETKYQQRCELNANYYLLLSYAIQKTNWISKLEGFNIFMITAESFDNGGAQNSESEGVSVIKRVKQFVAEENEVTRTEINNLKIQLSE